MKKAPAKKQKKTDRQPVVRWVLIIVLVALAAFFVKHRLDVNGDAQRFRAAESRIEEVYEQIEAITGQPDKVVRQQTCDRANRKFEKGPLSCFVNTALLYKDRSAIQSTELMKRISGISTEKLVIGSGSADPSIKFIPRDTSQSEQVFSQTIFLVSDLFCTLNYRYPGTSGAYFMTEYLTENENMVLNISCGGPAKAEHYPLRN